MMDLEIQILRRKCNARLGTCPSMIVRTVEVHIFLYQVISPQKLDELGDGGWAV